MDLTAAQLSTLRRFDNLELLARQVVEGFIVGLHKSPFHGFSVEFAEHRLYNPGDSVKNLDWKVYARSGRLYTKRYEEETNLRCQVVIDASSSMYYPEGKAQNKLQFSIMGAAALIYLLKRQRDAFGLSIFADHVEQHTPNRSTQVHYKLLFSYLEQLIQNPQRNRKTAAAKCLHEIAENVHKRSLVVLFSDMMDNSAEQEELFNALQHLKYNKHEVILFDVHDKETELDFDFENRPYEFVDVETGEKIKLQSNQVKEFYVEHLAKYRKNLELRCTQYGIDLVPANISQDFTQILIPYLTKRQKMM
jgi:uncharacterized protein (DUF58 family)